MHHYIIFNEDIPVQAKATAAATVHKITACA
jgi:hypothetical protein